MAPNSLQNWTRINLLLTLTFFTVIRTENSGVQENPEKDNTGVYCPSGWMHYNKFCFTRGRGASDRAIAFYCDGFGGIGIKGICVTKARGTGSADKRVVPAHDLHQGSLLKISLGLADHGPISERRHRPRLGPLPDDDVMVSEDLLPGLPTGPISSVSDVLGDSEFMARICPIGWRHYGDICVYKPFTPAESCSLLGAVEFKGLCLKHADTNGLSEYKKHYKLGKRVCCCNHVNSRGNRYAC